MNVVALRYSGRFSRAWLLSPRHCVPAGSSAHAIPAEVAACTPNNMYVWEDLSLLSKIDNM